MSPENYVSYDLDSAMTGNMANDWPNRFYKKSTGGAPRNYHGWIHEGYRTPTNFNERENCCGDNQPSTRRTRAKKGLLSIPSYNEYYRPQPNTEGHWAEVASAESPMINKTMSSENYRNLVYGNINHPNWQTPGYPTSQAYQSNFNMANFIESASADVDEAQLQNSPFSPLPAIGCSNGYLGAARCNNGTFQGNEASPQQATAFQQGTVLAFTENFAGCGKAAEGKLANLDAISDQLYIKGQNLKKTIINERNSNF